MPPKTLSPKESLIVILYFFGITVILGFFGGISYSIADSIAGHETAAYNTSTTTTMEPGVFIPLTETCDPTTTTVCNVNVIKNATPEARSTADYLKSKKEKSYKEKLYEEYLLKARLWLVITLCGIIGLPCVSMFIIKSRGKDTALDKGDKCIAVEAKDPSIV